MKNQFMKRAIEISLLSVEKGTGPFGAVIVKDGKIIQFFTCVTYSNNFTMRSWIVG